MGNGKKTDQVRRRTALLHLNIAVAWFAKRKRKRNTAKEYKAQHYCCPEMYAFGRRHTLFTLSVSVLVLGALMLQEEEHNGEQ